MTKRNHDDESVVRTNTPEEEMMMKALISPRIRYFLVGLRHNYFLMFPISLIMLVMVCIFWLLAWIVQLPTRILGFILSPILSRMSYFIEFLYPTAIARIGHILLISLAQKSRGGGSSMYKIEMKKNNRKRQSMTEDIDDEADSVCNLFDDHPDKNRGYHSRTIEQRIEVIPGRVYIHPIAQHLDNIGYLVVCCPPPWTSSQKILREVRGSSDSKIPIIENIFGKAPSWKSSNGTTTPKASAQNINIPLIAFIVDCGDADDVYSQLQYIRKYHYKNRPIQIQSILSTHKHHDHTAGNYDLKNHEVVKKTLKYVFGGAVENVPCCNYKLSDGDLLPLPSVENNNMNDLIEVETIVVPFHTRGSVVYALRIKKSSLSHEFYSNSSTDTTRAIEDQKPFVFLFTGDTLFSGGGGVPFEAGSDAKQDQGQYDFSKHSSLRPGIGNHATEQCFAEILYRGLSQRQQKRNIQHWNQNINFTTIDKSYQYIVFPGHEYTAELLGRQFMKESLDKYKWQNLPPNTYFETLSQLYVSLHRRSLPFGSGKLLNAAPTTMELELTINPHLRSLKLRGEIVIHAINLWYQYFSVEKDRIINTVEPNLQYHDVDDDNSGGIEVSVSSGSVDGSSKLMTDEITSNRDHFQTVQRGYSKIPSTKNSWNISVYDIIGKNKSKQSVFTTVYTSELNTLINDIQSGKETDQDLIVSRLKSLPKRLDAALIRRRPVPGTLPSNKNLYRGLMGLVILGSRPRAITLGDSKKLNLPPPVIQSITNTDKILISKKRLITVLTRLGLSSYHRTLRSTISSYDESDCDDEDKIDYISIGKKNNELVLMINLLWKESHDYLSQLGTGLESTPRYIEHNNRYSSVDVEENDASSERDLIELGVLKWMLYGLAAKQPSYFCMPCSGNSRSSSTIVRGNEYNKKNGKNRSGESFAPIEYSESSASSSDKDGKHASEILKMKQHGGELVRHDILSCYLCRGAAGLEIDHGECLYAI